MTTQRRIETSASCTSFSVSQTRIALCSTRPLDVYVSKRKINFQYSFASSFQACAPRYVYYIFMNRMDPVGMCFSAKNNFRQIRAHRPCVESGRELFIFICINLFFFSFSLCHLKFCVPVNRRALPDMCGTRVILKDANPLVHATRLEITLPNFSSIRRVEQVSVYKLCTQSTKPTKIDLMNLSLLLDDGKVTINEISTKPTFFFDDKWIVCYFWFLKWLCRIIHISSTFYIYPYFIATQWAKLSSHSTKMWSFFTHCDASLATPVLPFWNALHKFTYYSKVLKY